MKGYHLWSYHPYSPLIFEKGDIYICRIVPHARGIHFEWLAQGDGKYSVYYRERETGDFMLWGETSDTHCDIEELKDKTDYEFYVTSGELKSRIRLARCGTAVGNSVVNYLHPDDEAYAFSGRYLCSPSMVRHPDGFLLASMDLYAHAHPQNLTLIFRSDDNGVSWHYVSELMPCFWGKLFIHKGELYMLSCSTEYGDLLIGKSTDGGKTFPAPVCLLRGSNGKNGNCGVHKNPQNLVSFNGRLYGTLEWGSWGNKEFGHAAMVMSCDENDDLLIPENWSFSAPVKFSPFVPELQELPSNTMSIEGTLVISPEEQLLNIMRFGKYNTALVYEVNTADHDAPLSFSHLMEFPANYSKFMIKPDPQSNSYYTVATRVYSPEKKGARNLLSLMRSRNLQHWEVVTDLMDFRNEDDKHIGFQYVDFEIEGDDIIFLCRTAMNGAHNFHNTNYSTFHRIKRFRELVVPT